MYHITTTQVQWWYNTFQLTIHSRSRSQKHIMDGDVWDLENQFHPKSSVCQNLKSKCHNMSRSCFNLQPTAQWLVLQVKGVVLLHSHWSQWHSQLKEGLLHHAHCSQDENWLGTLWPWAYRPKYFFEPYQSKPLVEAPLLAVHHHNHCSHSIQLE